MAYGTYTPYRELQEAVAAVLEQGLNDETVAALRKAQDAAAAAAQEARDFANEIDEAREIITDDLEIDDEPFVSVADEGVWVSAWVWVPFECADEG